MTSKKYLEYLLTCGRINSKEFDEVDKRVLGQLYKQKINITESFNELVLENGLDLNNYFELLSNIRYDKDLLESVMQYRRDLEKHMTKEFSISKIKRLNESICGRVTDKLLLSKRIFLITPIYVKIHGEQFRGINRYYNDECNIPSLNFKNKIKEKDINNVSLLCFYKDEEEIIHADDIRDREDYFNFRLSYIKDKISHKNYDIIITIFETRDLDKASKIIMENINYQFDSGGINFLKN